MGGKGSGTPKYTPEVHKKIVDALSRGCFKAHAAGYARISPDTLESWLRQGEEGVEPYAKLLEDVRFAIAQDALNKQTAISAAALGQHKGDWRAAAWDLEKKHPKLYGRIAELEALRAAEIAAAKRHLDKPYSPWKPPADPPQPPAAPPRRLDA